MTADIDMLALLGRLNDSIDAYVLNPFAAAKIGAMVREFADANVLHHTAEIEALRAAAARERDYAADAANRVLKAELAQRKAEAKVERLAEMLREAGIQYEVVFGELFKLYATPADRFCDDSAWASWQHRTAYDVFSKAQDLRALLRDQEEGK